MTEERIVLQESLREWMKVHGRNTYPEECCGLLFGIDNGDGAFVIRDVVQMENRASADRDQQAASGTESIENTRITHYGMDPLELYRHEKEQRETGNDILGFYHSHPDHPSIPSDEDIREMVPGMLYLILSVPEGNPGRPQGWKKDAATGQVRELRIYLS